jgi:hypothetical protein
MRSRRCAELISGYLILKVIVKNFKCEIAGAVICCASVRRKRHCLKMVRRTLQQFTES